MNKCKEENEHILSKQCVDVCQTSVYSSLGRKYWCRAAEADLHPKYHLDSLTETDH